MIQIIAKSNRLMTGATFAIILLLASALISADSTSDAADQSPPETGPTTARYYDDVLSLIWTTEPSDIDNAIEQQNKSWGPEKTAPLLEAANYALSGFMRHKILVLLADKTGREFNSDLNVWYKWLWQKNPSFDDDYANFKADFYQNIDPRFTVYFKNRQASAQLRLDEIRWGGVGQDSIPPLRNPVMISAEQATYLDPDNIVFGIEINGDARAYPKRILAWHELFTDTIGGTPIAGVYCTLCGTVIPYKTTVNGQLHELGTSGFLYRSNKLMYDKTTNSLWSTIKGEPVLGPLTDKGIALEFVSVVTTTWAEWRKRHPNTSVLSLTTGHKRDYGEGVAYSNYFASDHLMFTTPFDDQRLNNKQEILALRFAASPKEQLAIDTDFLRQHPIYSDQIGSQRLLVLTDSSGANRVYDPKHHQFKSYDQANSLTDNKQQTWTLTETALVSNSGEKLQRLPAFRAFWFGWQGAYPETRLIK